MKPKIIVEINGVRHRLVFHRKFEKSCCECCSLDKYCAVKLCVACAANANFRRCDPGE